MVYRVAGCDVAGLDPGMAVRECGTAFSCAARLFPGMAQLFSVRHDPMVYSLKQKRCAAPRFFDLEQLFSVRHDSIAIR
jgi:hypothetical protein